MKKTVTLNFRFFCFAIAILTVNISNANELTTVVTIAVCANPPTTNPGGPYFTCATVLLNGSIGGSATKGTWSSPSGGTFVPNDTTLNAVYIPSAIDSSFGSVTLTLTSDNPLGGDCLPAISNVVVTFTFNTIDDINICTIDGCNTATGVAFHNWVTDGALGQNDNDPCTDDYCIAGNSVHTLLSTINDNNACTTDGCDTNTGFVSHAALPDGSPGNNDNNGCTIDVCTSGNTIHTNVTDGNPGDNDNDACTNDWCLGGVNQHTLLPGIDDNNNCTIDVCDINTGAVSHSNVPDGTAGDTDINACTDDVCISGATLHTIINSDDNNICTNDGCNTSTGVYHTPLTDGSPGFNDGNACTNDYCMGGSPVNTPLQGINDSNPCTIDGCDTGTGIISHINASNGMPGLSDFNLCTDDVCSNGITIYNPVYIDDANACTHDACNTSSGAITHVSNVDDYNFCTTDACDTFTGPTHLPLTGVTDDGNICTSGENCNNGVFIPGVATFVDDNDICTFDECNSITGAITHTPVSWDDGNACTLDYCNTLTGVAVHAPTPTVFIGNDTTLSSGSTLILDASAGYSYLWSTGETTQTITINGPGLFAVTIMDQNGCIGSDDIRITLPTIIKSLIEESTISVFPNPSKGRFNIQFSVSEKSCRIEVINILNQIIYQAEEKNISTSQILKLDLNLPKGTYLLRLLSNDTSARKYIVVN